MTAHDPQFYASGEESAARLCRGAFEARLGGLGIHQIVAGMLHPRTNGKPSRPYQEIQGKIPGFEATVTKRGRARRICSSGVQP